MNSQRGTLSAWVTSSTGQLSWAVHLYLTRGMRPYLPNIALIVILILRRFKLQNKTWT